MSIIVNKPPANGDENATTTIIYNNRPDLGKTVNSNRTTYLGRFETAPLQLHQVLPTLQVKVCILKEFNKLQKIINENIF